MTTVDPNASTALKFLPVPPVREFIWFWVQVAPPSVDVHSLTKRRARWGQGRRTAQHNAAAGIASASPGSRPSCCLCNPAGTSARGQRSDDVDRVGVPLLEGHTIKIAALGQRKCGRYL